MGTTPGALVLCRQRPALWLSADSPSTTSQPPPRAGCLTPLGDLRVLKVDFAQVTILFGDKILTPFNDILTCLSIKTEEMGARVLEVEGNSLSRNRAQLPFDGVGPRAPTPNKTNASAERTLAVESRVARH
ncbi:hypothetical protein DPEC_G00019090 [Dallia pectoralis]|uniref:Uncharacterized protein n=1 Tax=Dallia pectoralis TaxID=75939 RepID=A0ACC2HFM2_DALPE|nr:hypothetical protein DPEC_G00019090 [Dallia pectoralis]